MSARFEEAELLKKQYTDKFVVVKSGVPELKRFQGLTGVVKTVNMSCRALVLFDGPADIAWYDIDPTFLTVVDAPAPRKVEVKAAKESPTSKEAPAAKAPPAAKAAPAPKPAGEKKLSPLEMIRQQAAGGAKPAAAPPAAGVKLSPLEMIRQQQAKVAGTAPAATAPATVSAPAPKAEPISPPAETPKPVAPVTASGQKLSPLELVRQQGAFKGK